MKISKLYFSKFQQKSRIRYFITQIKARDRAVYEKREREAKERFERTQKYRKDLEIQVTENKQEKERIKNEEKQLEEKIKLENENREKLIEDEKPRLIAEYEGTAQPVDRSDEEKIEREIQILRDQLEKDEIKNTTKEMGVPTLGNFFSSKFKNFLENLKITKKTSKFRNLLEKAKIEKRTANFRILLEKLRIKKNHKN